jgi:hypothetical protein
MFVAPGYGGLERKMIKDVLRRLGFDELLRQERPRLGEDYVFDSRTVAAAKELRVVHESVFLEETPLSIVRQIHLQHGSRPHTSLQVTLALCWNGFREALTLLLRFAASFERRIPEENVVNTAQAHQVGEFGVAWAWAEKGGPDILGFVRKNVFVGVRGHDAGELIVSLAKEVDAALRSGKPTEQYRDTPHPLFIELRKREGEIPKVPATGKLTLGKLPEGQSRFFFLTSSGSVNREGDNPQSWYYRAATQKGRQVITLYWVDPGILLKRDRLSVDVT